MWNRLTSAQREKLERWLFDQSMGYGQILARVESEFGIEATMTSLCRFYHRRLRERQALGLMESQFTANGLNNLKVDTNSLREAALKLVGKAALSVTTDKPEEIEQLTSLTEVLLEAEQNDLRRARLQFEQRCFDYEATVATVKEIPRIRAYMQAVQDDDSLTGHEKIKKVEAMLFHWAKEVKAGNVK